MAKEQKRQDTAFVNFFQFQELDLGSYEPEAPLPLTVASRVLYMLGDITSGPAFRFTQWLELVRKRSAKYRSSGFPHRPTGLHDTMPSSAGESVEDATCDSPPAPTTEISLWERLGKAAMLDIESSSFSWDRLSSLHHTEHSISMEHSEDEMNRALEVTVNSGGVVFFAFFNCLGNDDTLPKEAAAVIKISSSRMATQSERLGYEFAKWLGVRTPQARVIHNTSPEWLHIKEAAEKARNVANSEGDDIGEVTCFELLEALELSRCLSFMSYVHGTPLLENRLPCRQLGWHGNSANLLLAEKMFSENMNVLEEAFDSAINRYRPRVITALLKERRATSVDGRLSPHNPGLVSQASDLSDISKSPKSSDMSLKSLASDELVTTDLCIVAIDSGVPHRPPAGKLANDQAVYPKLVELLLNRSEFSTNLLHDITGGKLGSPPLEDTNARTASRACETTSVVREFRSGFRAALRDLQGFHIFVLTLHQKLDSLLRAFMNIISKMLPGESDKEDHVVPDSPSQPAACFNCPSSPIKEQLVNDNHPDCWHGKFYRGSGEPVRNLRLTTKLRDFHKFAKFDAESSKELEQWNEMLKNEAVKLCQENNFNTGFFEGSENNSVIDAYELKVRLEHILGRIALISDAANSEKPSLITNSLFIGGTLAARSVYTLQHLGITHILCLCSNEIGQSDSQFPDIFVYKNFSISDSEDTNIDSIFEEACDFIDYVEQTNGRVLVHCFEGKSRSATLILAYLMLRKNFTLLQAWNALKRVHRRAQPNDGFAKILLQLDQKLHGKVSMEWQQRKPMMKVCPICGKNAGLSSSSLKLHLQKSHNKLSSGSVDSAMTMEIQKVLTALQINRGGSVSPTEMQSRSVPDD
ncbi:Dual specificity protein phosphatase PHS1 [Quillaja saponaria]|uniref:Dual specificity protein phosphatase PHS1 n=1 Tax=Quillaja saponaria TaxID=32244 RepID=A0AAD7KTN1_QUISA|nr:Dual specificity protein phosphatase PHS1 [Quillaja saponaria]